MSFLYFLIQIGLDLKYRIRFYQNLNSNWNHKVIMLEDNQFVQFLKW